MADLCKIHLLNSNTPRWIPSHRSCLWKVAGPYWLAHASHLLCNSPRSIRSLASDAGFSQSSVLHRWTPNNATIKWTISAETWLLSAAWDFTRSLREEKKCEEKKISALIQFLCSCSVSPPVSAVSGIYSSTNPNIWRINASISCKRSGFVAV